VCFFFQKGIDELGQIMLKSKGLKIAVDLQTIGRTDDKC
jgi:hypothetical protein